MKDLHLLKNNDKREEDDIDWVQEFYEFLQGKVPAGISLGYGAVPKMSKNKAFSIIWYLQEHFPIIPDKIQNCSACSRLYNSHSEGYYYEHVGKFLCGSCDTYLDHRYDIAHYKCDNCEHTVKKWQGECKKCKAKNSFEKVYKDEIGY